MKKVKDGNTFNVSIPTYYVESSEELNEIPEDAPAGTLAELNDSTDGFKLLIKHSSGTWTEI